VLTNISNPNNPTGVITTKSTLQKIVDLAQERDIIILCDEVYRPLFHSISPMDNEFPPSILNMGYSKVIATGSLSKAFSLAGIRVGWIASRDESIIAKCSEARDYTTISVSQLDDQVATYAMAPETVHSLLSRNLQLAKKNLDLLDDFIRLHDDICTYVKPKAGTTAFVKICKNDEPVDDAAFCEEFQEATGVMFCPGRTCFGDGVDFKGYVRIGYVCETEVLVEGLKKLKQYFRKHF
jgi:aspartate/methionine/tyrosine aminotransferase